MGIFGFENGLAVFGDFVVEVSAAKDNYDEDYSHHHYVDIRQGETPLTTRRIEGMKDAEAVKYGLEWGKNWLIKKGYIVDSNSS